MRLRSHKCVSSFIQREQPEKITAAMLAVTGTGRGEEAAVSIGEEVA